MIRVEHEQRFAVPLETGFAFITDMANWPTYWPGFVSVGPGSRWTAAGDEARIVIELLGRKTELRMRLRRFEANRLVEYESEQSGLPNARHERHFTATEGGFLYRLVVDYEPREGLPGLYDRLIVRRGVARALRATTVNLRTTLPNA
jgi:Polyketide cyclase / dehydrase and lipid transport